MTQATKNTLFIPPAFNSTRKEHQYWCKKLEADKAAFFRAGGVVEVLPPLPECEYAKNPCGHVRSTERVTEVAA